MDKDVRDDDQINQPTDLRRRAFLRQTVGAALLTEAGRQAQASRFNPLPRLDKPVPFHWDQLISRAKTLASADYQVESNATVINRWIDSLHAVHPQGIHMIPSAYLGSRDQAPFLIEGLYPDNQTRKSVAIFLVENGQARQWIFRGNQFAYGNAAVATNAPQNLFYGGAAVWLPGEKAPFLRLDGIGQYAAAVIPGQFDTNAGIVHINPAVRNALSGNDSLRTRAIYLHLPKDRWSPIEVSLLVDSIPLSGAIHMRWQRAPDGSLTAEHHHIWFIRDPLVQIGLAPQHAAIPVSESLGCVRMLTPSIEQKATYAACLLDEDRQQIWRPLGANRQSTLTVFDTRMPVGFGLLHRFNRAAADTEPFSPSNRHTQCWTVPGFGWPKGNLELIETDGSQPKRHKTAGHGNLDTRQDTGTKRKGFLCWVPELPRQSPNEQRPLAVSFHQHWRLDMGQYLTVLLQTMDSRMRCSGNQREYQLEIEIDFGEGRLSRDPAAIRIEPRIHASRGQVGDTDIVIKGAQNGLSIVRLRFQLTANGPEPIALRAQLQHDKANISEIWLFTYLPGL